MTEKIAKEEDMWGGGGDDSGGGGGDTPPVDKNGTDGGVNLKLPPDFVPPPPPPYMPTAPTPDNTAPPSNTFPEPGGSRSPSPGGSPGTVIVPSPPIPIDSNFKPQNPVPGWRRIVKKLFDRFVGS